MYNKASSVIACNTPSVAVLAHNRGLMNSIQRNNINKAASALMLSLYSFTGFLEAHFQMTMGTHLLKVMAELSLNVKRYDCAFSKY